MSLMVICTANVFPDNYDIIEKNHWDWSEKTWVLIPNLLLKLVVSLWHIAWLLWKEADQILLKYDDYIQCQKWVLGVRVNSNI